MRSDRRHRWVLAGATIWICLWLTACPGGPGPGHADAGLGAGDASRIVDAGPEAGVAPPTLLEQLGAVPGLVIDDFVDYGGGVAEAELYYEQPVDHDQPDGASFAQQLTLIHRSATAPMVLVTAGYRNFWRYTEVEPTQLFHGNQLVVEHRYFGESLPNPSAPPWEYLTIAQAAADHHRVVTAFKTIYPAHWLSTGSSKGGMTAVYHRRFYPADVDGTLAYVAPLSLGAPDPRYIDFLAAVGDVSCRQALRTVQIELLTRRATVLPLVQAQVLGASFLRIGGLDAAFEAQVINLPFTFWQYAGGNFCPSVPGAAATDVALLNFLDAHSPVGWMADAEIERYTPYYYQAHRELGYPAEDASHLSGWLISGVTGGEAGVLPVGAATPIFDPGAMVDIADWVATDGAELMFIYGEVDPWSARAFTLGGAADSYRYWVAGGTHYADLQSLTSTDYQAAYTTLRRWLGLAALRGLPTPAPPWSPPKRFEREPYFTSAAK